jgi:hypothetical protein
MLNSAGNGRLQISQYHPLAAALAVFILLTLLPALGEGDSPL